MLSLEAGNAGTLRLDALRAYFDQFGARVRVTAWWNGAALDRTIDERHAAIAEAALAVLKRSAWMTMSEVTYSEYGERGSIDVFAAHESARAVFVGEVKSEWGSIEETNRSLDAKARLAPKSCFDRLGWRPTMLAKVLILREDGSSRRIANRYRETLAAVYPARSREVRRWIRQPSGSLSGLWFLSDVARL